MRGRDEGEQMERRLHLMQCLMKKNGKATGCGHEIGHGMRA